MTGCAAWRGSCSERDAPPFVSVKETCRRFGLSLATGRRRIKDGSWPYRRDGKRILVDLVKLRGMSDVEIASLARASRSS